MLTIVMPYYKNRGMLERHIDEWKSYPIELKAKMQFIVVDDGSPDGHDAFPIAYDAAMINLQLYKILVDIPWNQDGARNLGMKHAKGWCVMTDMDHLLTAENAQAIIDMQKTKSNYYQLARKKASGAEYHRHPNSYLIHTDTFWDAGGYDEDFAGHYGSDGSFKKIVNTVAQGFQLEKIYLVLFGREVIADASTTDYGRKDSKYYIKNNNALYLKSKKTIKGVNPIRFNWERLL